MLYYKTKNPVKLQLCVKLLEGIVSDESKTSDWLTVSNVIYYVSVKFIV